MICRFNVVFAALLAVLSWQVVPAWAQDGVQGPGAVQVDTALVVSVDVSNSVDENRYRLQMEGIAAALEDPGVIEAIINGPNGGILFSMVTWADRPEFALPWVKIASKEDAKAVAAKIRKLPQAGGEFTCMTRMMRSVNDKIVSQIPGEATRVVLDISGDGPDNCNAEEAITDVRDELVANGVTVNGLPINIGDPGEPVGEGAYRAPGSSFDASQLKQNAEGPTTLEQWYLNNVMGGLGAFVLPANGYSDFGRAIRQKFVIEISGIGLPGERAFGAASTGNTAK
jgi:hypothetical protein